MAWSQKEIEEILKNNLVVNSNKDSLYNCFYKCANKEKIFDLFNQINHELVYGRRGTGKTTLFKGLCYYVNTSGLTNNSICRCIYIDMEDVIPDNTQTTSNNDNELIIETYRKLLCKLLEQLLEFYTEICSSKTYYNIKYSKDDLNTCERNLNELFDLILCGKRKADTNVEKQSITDSYKKENDTSFSADIEFGVRHVSMFSKFNFLKNRQKTIIKQLSIEKTFVYVLDINAIKLSLERLIESLRIQRLIICIDEFTRVDKGIEGTIQPYIAQLIKDTFFRSEKITVKLSSLWNHTKMQIRQLGGKRIGIELGDDIQRGADLDTMFFGNNLAYTFFKEMLLKTCLIWFDTENNIKDEELLQTHIINSLFADEEAFMLLICGSQGIPRVFGNMLISCIKRRIELNKSKIDPSVVYQCVIENFTRDVRRKLPYDTKIVSTFDDFITEKQSRFLIISLEDYEENKQHIEGLVDNNYMHQYPSETIHRRLRNRFKVFLIHYGNYLESLGLKEWRKNSQDDISLYPSIPDNMITAPQEYQLHLG